MNNQLNWGFWLIIVIAVYHLIYEGILLPSIRLNMRFKFFRLRDRLRALKLEHTNGLDDEIFMYMQDSINASIKLLPQVTFSSIHTAGKKLQHDEKLREWIRKKEELIDNCHVQEVQAIRSENIRLLAGAVIANSGGWFIYIVPMIAAVLCFHKLKEFITKLVLFPGKEVDKVTDPFIYSRT